MLKFRNYINFFLSLFLFSMTYGNATEYQPWLGNFYEFELRSSAKYQKYTWLRERHLKKYSSNDVFLNLSVSNALPNPAVGMEMELTQAKTRRQNGNIDQLKFSGRYVWLDDVAGDPISVVFGANYAQAFRASLRDVSSFHHGYSNTECFISLGKEISDESLWKSRWWSMLALGFAERGSAWLRFHLDYQKLFHEKHALQAYLQALCGFGHHNLHLKHFEGYGAVQHRSVDLGLRYTYLLEFYGNASLEYSYRVYARNFPCYTHQLRAQILYTFGL